MSRTRREVPEQQASATGEVSEAFVVVNGVSYHLLVAGEASHPPPQPVPSAPGRPAGFQQPAGAKGLRPMPALWLLHGFTGSAQTWMPLLRRFGVGRRAVAVDLLGHGLSEAPRDPGRYSMPQVVADLVALLDAVGERRADVLGYSMGGRVALHLALRAPDRIRRLVLESSSPGIADPRERERRREADFELAGFIEREGLQAFVERWEKLPLFESQSRLPERVRMQLRAVRLAQRPQGLANALRGLGPGSHPPLWGELGRLRPPTLIVAGELDGKYSAISREMSRAIPRVRLALVPGCGHAVHLERPRLFERLVRAFLEEGSPAAARPREGRPARLHPLFEAPGEHPEKVGRRKPDARRVETNTNLHGHPLRDGGGHGQDHHQPPGGSKRLSS